MRLCTMTDRKKLRRDRENEKTKEQAAEIKALDPKQIRVRCAPDQSGFSCHQWGGTMIN